MSHVTSLKLSLLICEREIITYLFNKVSVKWFIENLWKYELLWKYKILIIFSLFLNHKALEDRDHVCEILYFPQFMCNKEYSKF